MHVLFLAKSNSGLADILTKYPFLVLLALVALLFLIIQFFRPRIEQFLKPSDPDRSLPVPKGETKKNKGETKKPEAKEKPAKKDKGETKKDKGETKKPEAKEKPAEKDKGETKKQDKGETKKPEAKEKPVEKDKGEAKKDKGEAKKEDKGETKKPEAKEKPAEKDKGEAKKEDKGEAKQPEAKEEDKGEEKQPEAKKEPTKAETKELTEKERKKEERRKKRRERTARLREKREVHVSEMQDQEETERKPRTLQEGLEKTRKGWVSKLNNLLLGKKTLNKNVLEDLEAILFGADVGTKTTQRLLSIIEEKLERSELKDADKVRESIKDEIYKIINLDESEYKYEKHNPYVIMVVGVNGVGKTTTIGKIAARLSRQGKKVMLAAGDTFRAAADEQLEIWSKRVDAELVRGQKNQDPSSVIFDAIKAGVARDVDVILADTAGRLHTQQNLMEELKKVHRVMDKAHEGAPHEVMLVLDATIGQNAINQAKEFHDALGLSGIALTKLDGTAKGGVIIAICNELKIPVRYVGVGEHIDELKIFDPSEFVDALFAEE